MKTLGGALGFMLTGFVLNFFIGIIAYMLLSVMTSMRRIDKATVAGYYGSDSAGTFATCVGVLGTVGMAFDAYMPVMLAIMEIPGCLVALYLVARLRHKGMDALGNMPDEPGYDPSAKPLESEVTHHDPHDQTRREQEIELFCLGQQMPRQRGARLRANCTAWRLGIACYPALLGRRRCLCSGPAR